jgi:methyl-accepting chemotaxis protein
MVNLKNLRIAKKLPLIVIAAALVSITTIGISNYITAAGELNAAAERQLVALGAARQKGMENYLKGIREDMIIMSANETVRTALRTFTESYADVGKDGAAARYELQRQYISENPNPTGEKHRLDRASADTAYNRTHGKYHPWFRRMLKERGYYDIFLFDTKGNLVYTVFKELDYATNLTTGKWRDTGLGEAFRGARDKGSAGSIAFIDFAAYGPSHGAPASFIATPIHDGGRFAGVLAFQMPVDRINQVMKVFAGMGESGETYLVGGDRLMRSDSRFSKESTILKTKVDTPTVRQALSGGTGFDVVPDYRGIPVLSAYAPLDFEGVRWALMAEIDKAEVLKPTNDMRNFMFLIALIVMGVVGVAGLLFARTITHPVQAMTEAMQRLAGGDKTADVFGTDRTDELGDMAKTVQVFKESMIETDRLNAEQETERKAKEEREEAIKVEQEAERKAKEERAEAINELTRGFDEKIGGVLTVVAEAATELQATAQQMSSTAEEASRQSANVATASSQASANVQTVAAATEELSISINEIGSQVSHSARIAGNAADQTTNTNLKIQDLAGAVERISEVVNMIQSVAEQTNLLALNATIEAARAGDAGKGFAVVAAEVKDLANQTARATEEISSQIHGVQSETKGAVDAIDRITQVISEINGISTGIASAVEEQGVSTEEIARNVQQAAKGTQDVNENIESVNTAAGETGAAASQVLTSSENLAQQAEELRTEVETFLSRVRAA